MPSPTFDQFSLNLARARNVLGLANAIEAQSTQALDVSDIRRGAYVMGVSALDHFVHERVRLGILDTYQMARPKAAAFSRFRVDMGSVLEATRDPTQVSWLDEEVRTQHSVKTFQRCDRIADACRLITDRELWKSVASDLGRSSSDLKRDLDLIIDRRNKIAHEVDIDPTSPDGATPWPIDGILVQEALDLVEAVTLAIDNLI